MAVGPLIKLRCSGKTISYCTENTTHGESLRVYADAFGVQKTLTVGYGGGLLVSAGSYDRLKYYNGGNTYSPGTLVEDCDSTLHWTTGGYLSSYVATSTYAEGTTCLRLVSSGAGDGWAYLGPGVPASFFATLRFYIHSELTGSAPAAYIDLSKQTAFTTITSRTTIPNSFTGSIEIDVTTLSSGTWYPRVLVHGDATSTATVYWDNVKAL